MRLFAGVRGFGSALVVVLLGLSAPAEAAGKRVALVVGNAHYANAPQLANSGNDAKLIAQTLALKDLGFTLIGGGPQIDLDKDGFERAVREFGRAMQGADIALFYYAGHGLQVAGTNWLVPVDAKLSRPQDLEFVMIDAGAVLRQMQGAGTRLNVVVLDACRDNPFLSGAGRGIGRGLAQMQAPEGTLISYATQPGAEAEDGSGRDSPYSTALSEAMRQPGLDLFQMFNRVGLQVKRATDGRQLPWVSNSPIDGQFYFAGAGAAPPAPVVMAEAPAPTPRQAPPVVAAPAAPIPLPPRQQLALAQIPHGDLTAPPTDSGLARAASCAVETYVPSWTWTPAVKTVAMVTSGDGWCWLEPKQRDGSGFPGVIKQPPAHGEAKLVGGADGGNLYAYRPAPGFVGTDHVLFTLYPLGNVIDVAVDVRAGG